MASKPKPQSKIRPKPRLEPEAKLGASARAKTVDAYLAALSEDKRAALERVRKIVHSAAPGAEECISYQMPAFRLDGRMVLWIGAASSHCALYGVEESEKKLVQGYDTSGRGTIRFAPEEPLPAALIRKLVQARVARNAERSLAVRRRARRG